MSTEQLVVALEARIRDFERNFQKAAGTANNRFGQIERRAQQAASRMETSLRNSTANITKLMAGIGVGLSFNELKNMADQWSDLTSRVNNAVGSHEQGAAVMDRLGQIARRTYSEISATTDSFVKNSRALRDLGYSTQTQLDYTEALNNALVISSAKGQQAESVQNALAKAMADGELRGQNLNTVIQSGGRVAEALADALGTTVSGLRTLSRQGKLTGDVIVNSLTGELEKLREEADEMPATFSDSMIIMRNALTRYVGQLNEARGATAVFSDGIIYLADNIDSVAAAAAMAALVLTGRYVPALARATAAQAAMIATNPFLLLATAIAGATYALHAFGGEIHPIEGDLASLHDYAGAAWDTIRDGATTAGRAINDTLITAINFITDAIGGAELSFADLGDFVKTILNQIAGEFVFLHGLVTDVFGKLPAAVAEAAVGAMNSMIAAIERGLNAVITAVNATIESINSLGEHVGVTLGTIGTVTLGRITNAYAGAGEAAGEAYAEAMKRAAQDHVGNVLGAWREAANQRAAERAATAAAGGVEIDSEDNPVRPGGAGGSGRRGGGGRGGRGGRGGKDNEFDRQVAQLQERIALLRMETEARRNATGSLEEQEAAVERARIRHELLTAAQKDGIAITAELETRIDQIADAYMAASQEAKALADSQEEAARRAQEIANFGGQLVSGFVSDLRNGKSAAEAMANALNKVVDQLIDMAIQAMIVKPLLGMFGFSGGGLVGGGGGTPLKLASGGHVRGPGGPKDDKIPAMLSNGEFVVNADATAKHRRLLEAINSGGIARLADGGGVGKPLAARVVNGGGGGTFIASPTVNIKVEGGARADPAADQELAERIGNEAREALRKEMADFAEQQMRNGGLFNQRGFV